jgi:hypothetical protein
MSTAFKSMSDLVADSEDLLLRIGRSEVPQVRALMEPFRLSVDHLKVQMRDRAKKLLMHRDVAPGDITSGWSQHRWLQVGAAAFLVIGAMAWLCNLGKGRQ